MFYCFDPAQYYSGRRIPLTGSWLGECLGSQSSILASITSYWYISSYSIQPDTTVPTAQPVVQTPEPVVEPTGAPTVEPTSAPALPALTVVRQPEFTLRTQDDVTMAYWLSECVEGRLFDVGLRLMQR